MRQLRLFKPRARSLAGPFLSAALLLVALPAPVRVAVARAQEVSQIPTIAPGEAYRQRNLVSDSPGVAFVLDPLLVNPWGISMTTTSPFWVANAGSRTSTLYRGDVGGSPLVRNPGLGFIDTTIDLPTGTVANTSTLDFVLPGPCASPSCSARFIFAHITGHITGWNPNVPTAGSTAAVVATHQPGSAFTGLAIGNSGGANYLYAADFASGKILVYNTAFALQSNLSFPFNDPTIPTAPGNTYHPFNIQAIGSFLYVTYAKVDPVTGLDVEGVGNGYVRRFGFNGVRDATFAINNGPLNSPWGVALAPASFGVYGGALLVGNFGRGNPSIHAFNPTTGAALGANNFLQDESGHGIRIDELWALTFGNGGAGGDPNTLYFTAGIGEEQHGLFGALNPTTQTATSLVQFSTDDYAISEGAGHIDITVTRDGDASAAATVNYATFDQTGAGRASQKSDYEIALGTLRFAPGETSKTFRILLVDDLFDEVDETLDLILSNPTGAGVGLGTPNVAHLRILDNDAGAPTNNPIDDAAFFVRQHYLDFLNREPDAAGLAFWTNQITSCGSNAGCIETRRINTSGAFFLSGEFQDTGFLAYRTHVAAFGARPLYGNFMRDTQALSRGVIIGEPGALAQLEANKVAYFNEFVTRPEFVARYPASQTNEQYVDALLASASLSPSQVRLFIVEMTNAQENPPAVPTASGGGPRPASFGTARLQFNEAQTALTITGTVNNIDFTGAQTPGEPNDNLANAHIHASATVTPTTNAGVVFGFIGTPFNDNNPNDAVVTPFTGGAVGGTFRAKWDAPEGNNTTLAAQLSNLRSGRAYVNFHTVQFGGGEIRGNIPAADAFRNSLVAGLNAGTETRATVLRKVAEAEELRSRELNPAFVAMQYFGYLRRDPDEAGFTFWLGKLNQFNGDFIAAEMVKAFITSGEYRGRFGPS